MLIFFHSFVIVILFINILLFEQFFPKHHQSIKLFKNPDFVSPYLGPKCLQRLSADDKSHCRELNILINYINCFHILKRPLNLDLNEPLYHLCKVGLTRLYPFFAKTYNEGTHYYFAWSL